MGRWCRLASHAADGTGRQERDLGGCGPPDLGAVDAIARAALQAARASRHLLVVDAVPELVRLLDLAGLAGVVEVRREAEGGEQPLGVEEVQEEGHLGDPPP